MEYTNLWKKCTIKNKKNKYKLPWVNKKLKHSLKTKARLHRQAKKSGKWDRYRSFQCECKKQFRYAEWNHINSVIQEGLDNKNSKPFWKYVKCKKQDNIGVSPLKQKGNLISDSKGKADILVEQFQSVFTQVKDSILPDLSNKKIPSMRNIIIESKGVEKLLSNLKTSKAVGPDIIPNIVLKTCASELSVGLGSIFQYSLDTGTLPMDWRDANISPVFKKGDRHQAENYRPVSLTSISCKLLEHILCSHILKHFEQYNVLTQLNRGFRSGYSTEPQLLVTLQDLFKSFDQNIQVHVDVAILHFSKAFDTVPHDKLLHKIDSYGIQGNTLKWLSSFLKDRTMKVVLEGEQSKSVTVESGVPQSWDLMFLCHINDLPDVVRSQVRLFADDCLLYRQIKSNEDHVVLQKDLTELEIWAS